MEENQKKERSTRSLNFGAYHNLDTVGPRVGLNHDQDKSNGSGFNISFLFSSSS